MPTCNVLCFTTSYKRHKMLRGTICDVLNQSYPDIFHSVNIAVDADTHKAGLDCLFSDIEPRRYSLVYNVNSNQHRNYLNAIQSVENLDSYDLFVKIDDDDIYKREYVQTIVDYFSNHNVDVASSRIRYQLKVARIVEGDYTSLGGNPPQCNFMMPPTFAFNRKALDLILGLTKIYGFEDTMWRDIWCGHCEIGEVPNRDNIIWHIHGGNLSVGGFV